MKLIYARMFDSDTKLIYARIFDSDMKLAYARGYSIYIGTASHEADLRKDTFDSDMKLIYTQGYSIRDMKLTYAREDIRL